MTTPRATGALTSPNRNVRIEGIRVYLRPLAVSDVNEVYLSWINNEAVNQFISTRRSRQTYQDMFDYINNLRARPWGEVFGICDRGGKHVGNMSLSIYDPHNGIAGYGIMVGDGVARASGLGGEASALMIAYLFSDPAIRKVTGGAMAPNTDAWRLMEALGFRREGVLREHSLTRNGDTCDWYNYGLLKNEWEDNRRVHRIVKHFGVTDLE